MWIEGPIWELSYPSSRLETLQSSVHYCLARGNEGYDDLNLPQLLLQQGSQEEACDTEESGP